MPPFAPAVLVAVVDVDWSTGGIAKIIYTLLNTRKYRQAYVNDTRSKDMQLIASYYHNNFAVRFEVRDEDSRLAVIKRAFIEFIYYNATSSGINPRRKQT